MLVFELVMVNYGCLGFFLVVFLGVVVVVLNVCINLIWKSFDLFFMLGKGVVVVGCYSLRIWNCGLYYEYFKVC